MVQCGINAPDDRSTPTNRQSMKILVLINFELLSGGHPMQGNHPLIKPTRLPVQQSQAGAGPSRTWIVPNHPTRVCYKTPPRDRLFFVENPDFHEKDDQSD